MCERERDRGMCDSERETEGGMTVRGRGRHV